jgi:hypothetical protein
MNSQKKGGLEIDKEHKQFSIICKSILNASWQSGDVGGLNKEAPITIYGHEGKEKPEETC